MHELQHILIHTVEDCLKLLPFLFITFLVIEFLEHKMNSKMQKWIQKSGKFGPIIGSSLGVIPQCGFSVAATNLYVTRVISLGTLIAIYLSTSDEMLPILISQNVEIETILKLILLKWFVGIIFGILIDFIFRKNKKEINYELCDHDHCQCEKENIFISAIKHTINTMIFILIITFVVNFLFEYFKEEFLSKLFFKDTIFAPFIASLIGLIPNCGSSVMLTELYVQGVISFASCIAGLLTGSGVAILVLFKTNKNVKENIMILSFIYFIGVLVGLIIECIGLFL